MGNKPRHRTSQESFSVSQKLMENQTQHFKIIFINMYNLSSKCFLKKEILLLHIKVMQISCLILGFKDELFNSCLNLNTKNIHIIYSIYSRTSHSQRNREHSMCNQHIVVTGNSVLRMGFPIIFGFVNCLLTEPPNLRTTAGPPTCTLFYLQHLEVAQPNGNFEIAVPR